ncbi:DnaJ/Hsp40 cysteine-rich domain superfamily protein [Rhynchospora pubera]|uniref:DnaJ/Hsp40 cysteine-rich domain superfamily protein n=1 Tax=Rhynchospora pubera TaxID=906938 RepID=A0AAV8FEV8_9POAL|nr:DnaJ/Hsp40 cysteine-rich domain superfamily protein [Rhynchospora pubera]
MVSALSFTSTGPFLLSSRTHSSSSYAPKLLPLSSRNLNSKSLKAKAAESKETNSSKEGSETKKKSSILCSNCEGNGVKLCGQCEGSGVNKEEHFNGKFKVGGLCWLCRGKKEVLCGDCNGAGFLGGFLSALDETAV